MAPVLAYWKIRGLAQPIRLLLAYSEVEFEEKMYEQGPPPDFDKSCWFDVKYSLGLDFPNLPYYIDGDMKMTQSSAIMRYICRKYKPELLGTTDKEKDRCDLCDNQVADFRSGFTRLCYNPQFKNLVDKYLEGLPTNLKLFSEFLGTNTWLAGDNLTFPDFMLYEMLDQHMILTPTCLDAFPNLKQYHQRFQSMPQIQKYMASPRYMKSPLNNRFAQFGNV